MDLLSLSPFFFSCFFGNLCRHTPILLTKASVLQRLTFFSHLEERVSFHSQWGCGEELLQQKIWKLVSINSKGEFSILKRNNNFNVHLGGGLSFICVAVRMQARNRVISKELNSPASLFSLAKLNILYSVQDFFFSPPGKFLFFLHSSILPWRASFESPKTWLIPYSHIDVNRGWIRLPSYFKLIIWALWRLSEVLPETILATLRSSFCFLWLFKDLGHHLQEYVLNAFLET